MMTFDNSTVRRQDRLLDRQRADLLLRTAEYGTLSMVEADSMPYGMPINFGWDGTGIEYAGIVQHRRSWQSDAQTARHRL